MGAVGLVEDAGDDYLEAKWGYAKLWDPPQPPLPPSPEYQYSPDSLYAETDGRLLRPRESFVTKSKQIIEFYGDGVELKPSDPDLEISTEGFELETRSLDIALSAQSAVTSKLSVSYGLSFNEWLISFVEEDSFENLDAVDTAINELVSHRDSYTQDHIDRLGNTLNQLVLEKGVPQDFVDGIKEYHMALFHESLGEPNFSKRLSRAVSLLSPLAEHSKFVRAVLPYFHFVMNDWGPFLEVEGSRHGSHSTVIQCAGRYFGTPFDELQENPIENTCSIGVGINLLISEKDQLAMELADLIGSSAFDKETALDAHQRLLAGTADADYLEAKERLLLLEARLFRKIHEPDKARQSYQDLKRTSKCDAWNLEIDQFITQQ